MPSALRAPESTLDAIRKLALLDRGALEADLDFQFGARNLLVTFHPVTLEPADETVTIALGSRRGGQT